VVDERSPKPPEPFRIEGEDGTERGPARPLGPVVPTGPVPAPEHARDPDRPEVSAVPVRERLDPSARTVRGALPPPAGWPGEAWRYPLRGRGALSLSIGALAFALADAASGANPFVGGVLKVGLYAVLFLWTVRAVADTADGKDVPPPISAAASLEPDGLAGLLRFGVVTALYAAPAVVIAVKPWLEDPRDPSYPPATVALLAFVLAATLLVGPVVVLGHALSMPRLAWPWHAAAWVVRGFRAVLAVAAGWAVLVGVEAVVARTSAGAAGTAFALHLALRALSLLVVAAGARALGVLGRRLPL
jgi:hypothetical protein